MRHLIFFFPIIFFLSHVAFSQSWQWAATAGGLKSDKATDMAMDTAGKLYVCGYYNELAMFGNLQAPSTFGKDGFLVKMDTAGNFTWLKTANGGWDERVLGMCSDKSGYVYVTGTCWNYTDFGSCPGNITGGSDNIFVSKFDLDGNCQWLVIAGGPDDDQGYDLVTDDAGNIYVTGFISDEYSSGVSAEFGSIIVPVPLGDSIGFVAKMNPSGIFQWVRTFPGTDGERDNRIAIDSLSNVYIAGGFTGTQTFGSTTLVCAGDRDVFVIKYDSAGNFSWAQRAGGLLDDRANSITVHRSGDIYLTGEFRDKAGFGTDSINNNGGPNGRDIFVARMNPNGEWIWAKKAGSNNGGERGDRIISNAQGNIFITGQFMGNASFGPIVSLAATAADSLQLFVASIDTAGKWQWALQGGGTYEDRGNSLACDDSCSLYNAGYYKLNSVIGADMLTGAGAKDIFVAKINQACATIIYPVAAFTADSWEICPGECISFADASVDASLGVQWSFEGGSPAVSTAENPEVCYAVPGVYTVELTAANSYGSNTASALITVHDFPAMSLGPDTCIQAGSSLVLNAGPADSYQWNTGDTSGTIAVSPLTNNSYFVIITENNCTWGDEIFVKVTYPASISGDTSVCSGDETILTASPGTGYVWNTGGTTSSIIVYPISDTVFSVTITDLCDTMTAYAFTNIKPLPFVSAGNDTSIILGTNAHLYASGGNTYLWNTSETGSFITVEPEITTVYSVVAIGQNGCLASDSVLVSVDSSATFFIPTVFTPNGDGINDMVYVKGRGIKRFSLSIFDRWGEEIFYSDTFSSGWDGTFLGEPLNAAVFMYIVRGEFYNGMEIKEQGNITLLR